MWHIVKKEKQTESGKALVHHPLRWYDFQDCTDLGGTQAFEDLFMNKIETLSTPSQNSTFIWGPEPMCPHCFSSDVYKYPWIYMCTRGHHSIECQLLPRHLYAGLEIKHILDSGPNDTILQWKMFPNVHAKYPVTILHTREIKLAP